MKILFSWLKEFVDVSESPYNVADRLTMAGIEVASVDYLGEGFDNIVVARIEKIEKHPNADKLSLCQVSDGKGTYSIVCGATNIQEGYIVPLALPGAVLPGGFEIKKVRIRGVTSEGMLCSERELGISDDHSGIMILPKGSPIGESLKDFLGLDDYLIEIEITPNRGDCLSVLGVAREVSALYGVPLKVPEVNVVEDGEEIEDVARVNVENLDLCPRYSSRVIYDVEISPSPVWLQQRLRLSGIRPINNVVDITNYILLELGQPMHAFDLDLLDESRIVVKCPEEHLVFRTLDGVERNIAPDMLLIWDGRKPVAVAGVMGGENTEVRDETKRVLFESAHFSPISIRRTAKRLGLSTESSYRFERGVDPSGTLFAIDRAISIMREFSSFKVCKGFIDVKKEGDFTKKVSLRKERAVYVTGLEFEEEEVEGILSRLGFDVHREEGEFSVTVPPHRFDVEREIDLIEELVRVKGYDKVPTTYPNAPSPHKSVDHEFSIFRERLADNLVSLGFTEAINYSFMPVRKYDALKGYSHDFDGEPIKLSNPISEDTAVMRPSLVHGLLKNISLNLSRYEKNLRIFEIGKVFRKNLENDLFEEIRLGMALSGELYPETPINGGREVDFYLTRSVMENLLPGLGFREYAIAPQKTPSLFSKNESAGIVIDGITIGYLGKVNPEVLKLYEIDQDVYLAELSLSKLRDMKAEEAVFKPLSKYPPVERDVSFILPYDIGVGDIVEYIRRVHETIRKVYVFDLFVSEKLGSGKKSVGFRILFQSDERTLTDEEVNDIHRTIVKLVENRFGGKLRS